MSDKTTEAQNIYVSAHGILKSTDYQFVFCSDGILRYTDHKFVNYKLDEIKYGSTIYVPSLTIPHLKKILDTLPNAIILVSGDGDESVPFDLFSSELEFLSFIENPKIIHWFAQNGVIRHPKFSQIPVGIDYHTMSRGITPWGPQLSPVLQEEILIKTQNESSLIHKRIVKAYANFHFQMWTRYGQDRTRAKELIPGDLVDYETRHVDRETTWRNQSHYAFVISPYGNGMDCCRTWEALCLGCIPIVKSSPLDSLYENLPVYIVNDWNDVTEENLKRVLNEFSHYKFDLNRLTLKYWMDKIKSKKIS
jgi:hypothetical protein